MVKKVKGKGAVVEELAEGELDSAGTGANNLDNLIQKYKEQKGLRRVLVEKGRRAALRWQCATSSPCLLDSLVHLFSPSPSHFHIFRLPIPSLLPFSTRSTLLSKHIHIITCLLEKTKTVIFNFSLSQYKISLLKAFSPLFFIHF